MKRYCNKWGGKNRVRALGFWRIFTIFAGAGGLLFASSWVGFAESAPKEKIVVGAVLDITGQGAARGREARNALHLEEQRLNRERGNESREILLVIIDTAGKPEAAASGVRRLAREYQAVAIVGPSARLSALAAAREAERLKIPMISLTAPEAIILPARRWIFSTAHPVSLAVRRSLAHIRAKGFRRAAILVSDDGFGAEGREILSELAPEMGISVLLNNRHNENEHNLLPYLQKANVRGAEAFIHWARGPSRLALARARNALDIKLPIYMALVSASTFDLKNAGKLLDGTVFPASRVMAADLLPKGTPGLESLQAFRTAYRDWYGHYPDGLSGSAADALRIVEAALGRKNIDRAHVRDNIERMSRFEGLTGVFQFSETDHSGLSVESLVMVRIQKGKWKLDEGETAKFSKKSK